MRENKAPTVNTPGFPGRGKKKDSEVALCVWSDVAVSHASFWTTPFGLRDVARIKGCG